MGWNDHVGLGVDDEGEGDVMKRDKKLTAFTIHSDSVKIFSQIVEAETLEKAQEIAKDKHDNWVADSEGDFQMRPDLDERA